MGKITFDESDLSKSPIFPDVDELQFGPVLISRDDMRNWPFARESEPTSIQSGPKEFSERETPQKQENAWGLHAPNFSEGRPGRHRRNAAKEAILALWPDSLPQGILLNTRRRYQ